MNRASGRILATFAGLLCTAPLLAAAIPTNNLILWLDANDTPTVVTGAANRVSQWMDKSGRGHHAAGPGGQQPPAGGTP